MSMFKETPTCKYNTAVDCIAPPRSGCTRCGWNPEVEKRRKAEIEARMTVHTAKTPS